MLLFMTNTKIDNHVRSTNNLLYGQLFRFTIAKWRPVLQTGLVLLQFKVQLEEPILIPCPACEMNDAGTAVRGSMAWNIHGRYHDAWKH
jgi:hypothetical protein